MTNFEKIKKEIAEMDAREFSKKYKLSFNDLYFDNYCVFYAENRCPKLATCEDCRRIWLESEV